MDYYLTLDTKAHLFNITLNIDHVTAQSLLLRLPSWIPGSYMIRDFNKHLLNLQVVGASVTRLDKQHWQLSELSEKIVVTYQIVAMYFSPRGAYLDNELGIINGSRLFFEVVGGTDSYNLYIDSQLPVVTTLTEGLPYQQFIDHPICLGQSEHLSFNVRDIVHNIFIFGQHQLDSNKLLNDVAKACCYVDNLFGPPHIVPKSQYNFYLFITLDNYGGLEHSNSTVLMARFDEDYTTLVSLFVHEYFHTWNVKTLKPLQFNNYDLTRENYTTELWFYEGFTSYYDELILKRVGIINEQQYLALQEKNLTWYLNTPGVLVESLATASFLAWTNYYKPDNNTPNASTSYYVAGALFAMVLDLAMREHGKSLDIILQKFWQQEAKSLGIIESGFINFCHEELGAWIKPYFQYITEAKPLPLATALNSIGINLTIEEQVNLGVKLKANSLEIQYVYSNSPAEAAGLMPDDLLVAIDNKRLTLKNIDAWLKKDLSGQCHYFRRNELKQTILNTTLYRSKVVKLSVVEPMLLARWLD